MTRKDNVRCNSQFVCSLDWSWAVLYRLENNRMYDLLPLGLRIALKAREVRFSFLSNNLNLLYLSAVLITTCIRDVQKCHPQAGERRERHGNNLSVGTRHARGPLGGVGDVADS